jgi:hypothetical protein
LQENLARTGQVRPSAISVEQAHAKSIFKLLDGARQRRLLHVQSVRSSAEVEFLRQSEEASEMSKVQPLSPLLARAAQT